jgi:hypothetical protein
MVIWIRSPLKYCCVNVSCIATNSGKATVSIATARCYKWKAVHNSELVSRWKRNELVFGSGRSQSTPVHEGVVASESPESEESVLDSESAISKSCSNKWSEITQSVFSCELCQLSVIVMCAAINLHSE